MHDDKEIIETTKREHAEQDFIGVTYKKELCIISQDGLRTALIQLLFRNEG